MTKALITAAAFAALLVAGPVHAAQTSGAGSYNTAVKYEPQPKGSAMKYAPGQRKKPGESARKYAPGQLKNPGESAKNYAPGHLKKKPTKHSSIYTNKQTRSYQTSGATGAIKKKVQKSY